MLFEEAKLTFSALFPDAEAVDCTVDVLRLRLADVPDFRSLAG
jgi:hypothetical protein